MTVLSTSREPLDVQAESLLRLEPLGVPGSPDGSDLLDSAAGRFFADRVARVRSDGLATDDDRASAVEICRRLDGIPLALELAAARARSQPLRAVADRLDQRFSLLLGGSSNALARQRTLEASVTWSYDLLDPPEQTALRHLSTFSGAFDMHGVVAILDVEGDPDDLVASLVDKSLLLEESVGELVGHRMLETVRFFARDRAIQEDEASELRDRHLAWVRRTVEGASHAFEGAGSVAAVRKVDRMLEEVRAALEWARVSGDQASQAEIVTDLSWYWIWRGLVGDALERLIAVDLDDAAIDDGLRARACFALHMLQAHHQATHELVERFAGQAIAAARNAGSLAVEGRSRLLLATHRSFNDPVGRAPDVAAAAEICKAHGGPFWAALADAHVAQSSMFRLLLRDAVVPVTAAGEAAVALSNHQLAVESLARRAAIAEGLGDNDATLRALEDLDRDVGGVSTREFRGVALASVLWVQLRRGDIEGVVERSKEAIDGYLRDEDLQFVPLLVAVRAAALLASGEPAEACAELAPVWEHPEVQWSKVYSTVLAPVYASANWIAGDRETARCVARAGLSTADEIGSPPFLAEMECIIGSFDLDDGLPAMAEPRLHRSIETLLEHGHRPRLCDALEELARLELDFGRPDAAAVLLGATEREREAGGVVLRPWRQSSYEMIVEQASEALGGDLGERWDAGRGLALEDAVAFARRGRGERSRPTFGWDGLTTTELRVAGLAAQGLTNPQIAEQLLVGRETIKSHVASVLRKLGLRNRTELARMVHERDLAP